MAGILAPCALAVHRERGAGCRACDTSRTCAATRSADGAAAELLLTAVARAVAARILADPGEPVGVDVLCAGCGAARRTVERRFAEETGLGVARWRRRARLATALEALARGEPPSRVATEVGYASASAFGAMVTAELGHPPGTVANAVR